MRFFLEANAIFILYPKARNTEEAILAAFDAARKHIFAAAAKVYPPDQHRSFYTLAGDHFLRGSQQHDDPRNGQDRAIRPNRSTSAASVVSCSLVTMTSPLTKSRSAA